MFDFSLLVHLCMHLSTINLPLRSDPEDSTNHWPAEEKKCLKRKKSLAFVDFRSLVIEHEQLCFVTHLKEEKKRNQNKFSLIRLRLKLLFVAKHFAFYSFSVIIQATLVAKLWAGMLDHRLKGFSLLN
jgi:hypothetical protein